MKRIITILIILVLAFLVYNFSQTGMSFLEKGTKIAFAPEEIKAGRYMDIDLTPSKEGVDILMTVHSKNNLRKDSTDAWGQECANLKRTSTGAKCKYPWKFRYRVPASFMPGQYYFRFFDYSKNEFIKSGYFTVIK